MSAIERFFTSGVSLPAMPEVARQLIASFQDEDVDIRTVTELAEREQSIAVKVLRVANSPRYSPMRDVSSVRDASILLGMETLRNVVLSSAIVDAFPRVAGFDRIRFWKHAVATGGYARWLGRLLGVDPDSAYLAGFMLRSGQLLMARSLPRLVADVEARCRVPGTRMRVEREMIGCTHAEVTAELSRRWSLPPRLIVGFEGAPAPLQSRPFSLLAATLHLSAILADAGDHGVDPLPALGERAGDVLGHLGIDVSSLHAQRPPAWAELSSAVEDMLG
jgi:HD-like signal output (HDOD) protein